MAAAELRTTAHPTSDGKQHRFDSQSSRQSSMAPEMTWMSQESVDSHVLPGGKHQPGKKDRRRSSILQKMFGKRRSHHQQSFEDDGVEDEDDEDQTTRGKVVKDEYELLGMLGAGAFATVEKCRHVKTEETFAVKIFERSVLAKKKQFGAGRNRGARSALDKVEDEINVMKKLNFDHPNLVRMVEAFIDEDEDRIYMFMEFVERGPVMEFDEEARVFKDSLSPEGGPCPGYRAAAYLHDVATGLGVMHAHRIAHRDLKPANVLLTRDLRCKISDFGVARHFEPLEGDLTLARVESDSVRNLRLDRMQRSKSQYQVKNTEGTYAYFAPEMLLETPFNALNCDLWALGCLAYNLLTAKLPFDQLFTDDLFAAIAAADPDFSHVLPDQKDLLTKLLQSDPCKRATLSEVKAHPWVAANALKNRLSLYPLLFPLRKVYLAATSPGWTTDARVCPFD